MAVVSRQLLVNHSIAWVMCVCLQGLNSSKVFLGLHTFDKKCLWYVEWTLETNPKNKSNQIRYYVILWLQRSTTIVKEILKISTVLKFFPKKIYVSTFSKPFSHQRFLLKIGRCEWDLCEWGLLAFIKTDRRLSPNLLLNMNGQSVSWVQ